MSQTTNMEFFEPLTPRLSDIGLFGGNFNKIYRVDHHNKHGISITRLLRREWILNVKEKDRRPTVEFIVGECSLVQNVEEALYKGYIVRIVTGPNILSNTVKRKLIELFNRYGKDRLLIYCLKWRPGRHFALINRNALIEDVHEQNMPYFNATAIEGLDQLNQERLLHQFDELKSIGALLDTPEKISSMPVIEND